MNEPLFLKYSGILVIISNKKPLSMNGIAVIDRGFVTESVQRCEGSVKLICWFHTKTILGRCKGQWFKQVG